MNWIRIIGASLLLVSIPACRKSPAQDPPTGTSVTVQFRRDALGSAHNLPISPTTDRQNGAQVSMAGELKAIDSDWVVLKARGTDYWIPRSVVLLIKVPGQ